MIKTKKLGFWIFIMLFVSFFLLFKQINVYFPSYFIMLFLLLGCVIVSVKTKTFLLKDRCYVWLFLYFVVLILNYISGDKYFDSVGDVLQEVAILFFSSGLFIYVATSHKVNFANAMIFMSLAIIIYYSISSYLVELISPGVIRNMVYLINIGATDVFSFYYRRGVSTYQLPHAVPILIPALIMILRTTNQTKFRKFFIIATLLAIFLLVYISYATTAMLLTIMVIVLSLLVKQGDFKRNIVRIMVAVVIVGPIILNADIILKPLSLLFSSSDQTLYLEKLSDIQVLSAEGTSTGGLQARENKYVITLSEILESPLWGTDKRIGEHSALFDRWACLGLIGWIPYLIFLYAQIKFASRHINIQRRVYYFIGIIAAFLMLVTKNMSYWELWFMTFTVLPIMIWLPDNNDSEQPINS